MQQLMAAFLNGGTKRVVGSLLGVAFLALHNKFGIDVSPVAEAGIASIVTGWVVQSGVKAAKLEGAAAAEAVTPEEAKKDLDAVGVSTDKPIDPEELSKEIALIVAKFTGKAVALLLCVGLVLHSTPAFAADPADAPKVSVILKKGDLVPYDGTLRSPENERAIDQALVNCNTQNDSMASSNIAWPVVVVFVVAAAAASAAITFGVVKATGPKPTP